MSASPPAPQGARKLQTLPQIPGSIKELASDLLALGANADGGASRWLSRPAVLRRVALLLSEGVPARSTRIVTGGDGAAELGVAVSLTTGLPVAVVASAHGECAREVTFGEVHDGEDVSVLAVAAADLAETISWCEGQHLSVNHSKCVFSSSGSADALFVTAPGAIEEVTL